MMNNEIMVSVCFITYNHFKYVSQALDSILIQKTSFRYEIVIGDDCSKDNTQQILNEYKERFPDKINLTLRKENIGATKNIYDIVMKCNGKYLIILEGDDYWIGDQKLQRMVDFLESNPSFIGVSHVRERRDINGILLGTDPDDYLINKSLSIKDFLEGKRFSATATLFRNVFMNSNDKYRHIATVSKYVCDLTYCILLLDVGDIFILNECWGAYRVRNAAGESNYNSIRDTYGMYQDHISIVRAIDKFYNGKYNFYREYVKWNSFIVYHTLRECKVKLLFSTLKDMTFREKILLFFYGPIMYFEHIRKKLGEK